MSYTILKFGGTSVGSPERMKQVFNLVSLCEGKKIVVLSAVSGTTNALVDFHAFYSQHELDKASHVLEQLYESYCVFIANLLKEEPFLNLAKIFINEKFDLLRNYLSKKYLEAYQNKILAQGELMSTRFFELFLLQQKVDCTLIPALSFMRLTKEDEPDIEVITHDLNVILNTVTTDIIITQGYICRNAQGAIDNLKRGGSDYSASLIGAATSAREIQIWTDIDGMHNNDPRIVEKTYPVTQISFDEAAELSYFGAKILHPACILPAQKANIPVKILNTLAPDSTGTIISEVSGDLPIKAIAAKDNITAIRIKSSRMLLAYGFIRKVFEVFEKHQTSVDMITTSEVAVSCSIDSTKNLDAIIRDLEPFGSIVVDENKTIIAIVGENLVENKDLVAKIFASFQGFPIRMVSYGGSRNNISILISSDYKKELMEKFNNSLFGL